MRAALGPHFNVGSHQKKNRALVGGVAEASARSEGWAGLLKGNDERDHGICKGELNH